jgi:hypothetical protein
MPGFTPMVFIGMAFACWTLEKPVSLSQWLGKLRDLLILLPSGLLMSWCLTRRIVRALFFSKKEGY